MRCRPERSVLRCHTARGAQIASRWGRFVERRIVWLTVVMVVATVLLAAGLPRLEFRSSQDTMVSPDSAVYRENLRYQGAFGGEVMVVVFDGDIHQLFTAENRAELDRLTSELQRTGRFHAIIGPDTALEFAAEQIEVSAPLTLAAYERDLAAATTQEERDRIAAAFEARAAADGPRLAAAGEHRLDNPEFVDFLLFDAEGDIREGGGARSPIRGTRCSWRGSEGTCRWTSKPRRSPTSTGSWPSGSSRASGRRRRGRRRSSVRSTTA